MISLVGKKIIYAWNYIFQYQKKIMYLKWREMLGYECNFLTLSGNDLLLTLFDK